MSHATRRARSRALLLRRIPVGQLDGRRGRAAATSRRGRSRSHHPCALPAAHGAMLLRGSSGLAEAYAQELWDSPDLVALVRVAARNARALDRLRAEHLRRCWRRCSAPGAPRPQHPPSPPPRHRRPLRPRQRAVRADARPDHDLLVRAVRATRHDAARRLRSPSSSASARSSTCGPATMCSRSAAAGAAFALHAAATRGCRVTTTTISREQHGTRSSRSADAGLEDRVDCAARGLPRPARHSTTSSSRSR